MHGLGSNAAYAFEVGGATEHRRCNAGPQLAKTHDSAGQMFTDPRKHRQLPPRCAVGIDGRPPGSPRLEAAAVLRPEKQRTQCQHPQQDRDRKMKTWDAIPRG